MSKKDEALKLALDVLTPDPEEAFWFVEKKKEKAITAIREALMSVPDGADSTLDRMAENARELGLDYEPPCKTGSQCTSKCQQCEQPAQEPEFIKHEVENTYDWSEWVCPDPKGYLMKCCDCGLVHEAQFRVAKYKPAPSDECEVVSDPDLQAQFRMRRSEQWTPKDMAYRPDGLPMAEQPAQQQEPTCKQHLQVWVIPNGKGAGQFSWEPQDERFWTRMQPAQSDADATIIQYHEATIKRLETRIAELEQPAQQQEPEKVGRISANVKDMVLRQEVMLYTDDYLPIGTAIYTSSPNVPTARASKPWVHATEWRGLTDEEIKELDCLNIMWNEGDRAEIYNIEAFARAIEAKLREKNAQPSKPLTDEQIRKIGNSLAPEHRFHSRAFARAIEAAHGIKE